MDQDEMEGSRELFLQWALGKTTPVFFALANKKIPLLLILHSATNYVGEFGVEDHHSGEVVELVGERKDTREPMLVLIQPENLKTLSK